MAEARHPLDAVHGRPGLGRGSGSGVFLPPHLAVTLLDRAPAGLILLDANAAIVAASSSACRLLGLSREQLVGIGDLLQLADQLQEVGSDTSNDTSNGTGNGEPGSGTQRIYRRIVRSDGSLLWLGIDLQRHPDLGGLVVGHLADTTAEHRLARAVQLADTGLDLILATAPLPICLAGLDGRLQLWNPAAAALFGHDEDRVLGAALAEAIGATAAEIDPLMAAAFRGRPVTGAPVEARHADGRPLTVRLSLAPLRPDSAATSPPGVVCTLSDVTAELAADRALRNSEGRLRKILQSINDTITVIGADGRTLEGTGLLTSILGYDPSFWPGRNVLELIHADDLNRAMDTLAEVRSTPFARRSTELRVQAVDGSWQVAEGNAINLLDDPDVGGILITTRNITERKRNEMLIRGQAEILHHVVAGAPLQDTLREITGLVEALIPGSACGLTVLGEAGGPITLAPSVTDPVGLAAVARALHGGERHAAIVVSGGGPPGMEMCWSAAIHLPGSDDVHGWLTCLLPASHQISDFEQELASTAANLAAVAVERERAGQRLSHLAMHDELTGLANRHLLADRLDHALYRAHRHGHHLAVLFLDLDRFKVINDSLGHEAGDVVLRQVAERLSQVVRPEDTVARFGGDEFVVLVDQVHDDRDVDLIAERLERCLDAPFLVADSEHHVTASVGIVVSQGGDDSAAALLRNADTAMYRAKERGRNRREVFDAELREQLVERVRLEAELRRALERDELAIYFQPVVNLHDSGAEVAALEALLRWHHPERGLLEAAEFLPMAEETGLIVPVGRWAVEAALAELAELAGLGSLGGHRPPNLAVNLSGRQLAQPTIVAELQATLEARRWPAERLIVEFDETSLIGPADVVRANLAALVGIGVQLAIDDFGTGYASLTHLHDLPVSQVKIDRQFVAGLGVDPRHTSIVRAVVSMAHALSLSVVAEGVETELQVHHLRALGCDLAQGYALGAPFASAAAALGVSRRRGPFSGGA